MRMRLEPPELGELDLRLVLESGNKLTLAIAAERPDVAHLLQRHLDELQQTLRNAGLEVTGAEVQTRSELARQSQQQDQENGDRRAPSSAPEQAKTPLRPTRTVVAEGLDFWA
jgi:flagellar hook-length control protein FliK